MTQEAGATGERAGGEDAQHDEARTGIGRRSLLAGLGTAAVAGALDRAWPATPKPASPLLHRGVGLHGPFTWGETDAGRTTYVWPVYPRPKHDVPVALLAQAKKAGLDFVRLTVDPGPLIAFKDNEARELDAQLLHAIGQIRGLGLDVLVDLHPIWKVKGFTATQYEDTSSGGLFPRYVDAVRRVAQLIADDPAHLAIEPMNEPQLGYDLLTRWRWAGMQKELYDTVRSISPDLTVVVTGARGGSMDGLFEFDPAHCRDTPTRFSVHYYKPMLFTHQGVTFWSTTSRLWPYLSGLPYPAMPAEMEAVWKMVEKRIAASDTLDAAGKEALLRDGRQQIEAYFAGGGTRAAIAEDFDRIALWAKTNGIANSRILIGEFGATARTPDFAGADPADRARWIADIRTEAQLRGFGWSFWSLTGTWGMTLTSVSDPQRIDPLTARSLGLSTE